MILKSKPLPPWLLKIGIALLIPFFRRRFNKMIIDKAAVKPGHSYLLMCNHFGFLDGFFVLYLCNKVLIHDDGMQRLYTMALKKQMERIWWLKYVGHFSVDPGKRSVTESLDYAAEILSKPGNLLLFFPQGNLETLYIRHIQFGEGLTYIVPKIIGNCQLLWCSNLIEYFESMKPSVYLDMLDCGTNHEFDFDVLQQKVNKHHQAAIKKNIRFTKERIEYH